MSYGYLMVFTVAVLALAGCCDNPTAPLADAGYAAGFAAAIDSLEALTVAGVYETDAERAAFADGLRWGFAAGFRNGETYALSYGMVYAPRLEDHHIQNPVPRAPSLKNVRLWAFYYGHGLKPLSKTRP